MQIGRSQKKVMLPAFFFLLTAALFWIGYALFERREPPHESYPVPGETMQRDAMVNFDLFLIPLGRKSRYTLISLSFSLELPNGEVEKTMEQRMTEIRGFIYDTLREDFTHGEGIPSVQAVKDGIGRAVRLVLPGLQVKDVYISSFLAL